MAASEQTAEELLEDGAAAGEWILDPSRSAVSFKNRSMWGLVRVHGVFRKVTGNGTVSPTGSVSGALTVGAASIDTKNAKRDTHLRSADLFDSDQYPDITFVAETARLAGQDAVVTGALTVRGVTRPLTFDAAVSIRGDGEIGLDAAVRINRADFGLTWNVLGTASMLSTITIQATFTPGHTDE